MIALLGKRSSTKKIMVKYIVDVLKNQIYYFAALCASKCKRMIQSLYVTNTDLHSSIKRKKYVCLILDDCESDRSFTNSPITKDILFNGRH